MRTTLLILQLTYIYYVLPQAGIRLGPLTACVIGLTLHCMRISARFIARASTAWRSDSIRPPRRWV